MTGRLLEIYDLMYRHFGPRGWWPADSPYEMAVGAILTQSVSWKNVERAIEALKAGCLLDPHAMYRADPARVEEAVRPAGFYRQKTKKLLAFTKVLVESFGGEMAAMLAGPTGEVRAKLLAIHGVGPETADAILLYAGGHPVFVVDAYTRRIFSRLGFWRESVTYDDMQALFHAHLEPDAGLFSEYHALIDGVGNRYCRRRDPRCGACPLAGTCAYGRGAASRQGGRTA